MRSLFAALIASALLILVAITVLGVGERGAGDDVLRVELVGGEARIWVRGGTLIIAEYPDTDAEPVTVRYVVDGDTIRLTKPLIPDAPRSDYLRLVGYNAPEGRWTRVIIERACGNVTMVYVDLDDYEPVDRYGRALGYAWCGASKSGHTYYIFVNKYALINWSSTVKRISLPPDEHPWSEITAMHKVTIVCGGDTRIILLATDRVLETKCTDSLDLTLSGGYYRVVALSGGREASAGLDLLPD